jgi:hypothetical protein
MSELLYAGTELCWVSRNKSGKDSARVGLWEQSVGRLMANGSRLSTVEEWMEFQSLHHDAKLPLRRQLKMRC